MPLKIEMQGIDEFERGLIAAVAAVIDRVEGDVETLFTEAVADWPVDSGDSKRAMTEFNSFNGGIFTAEIVQPSDYARFIKHKGKHTVSELLTKPVRQLRREMERELGPLFARVTEVAGGN